ncbi:MAG: exonuclease SbcCD subunit D C-terminal domain-containing protein [Magnetococcales bacterium]|nr:exonuclease SbcCD subunit D C-terminal domain-containing protein [Magnetococcales bacterium]
MKIIHTADWHLGHELHGFNRRAEQDAFLQWLSATMVEQEADVLIVAGDLFNTVNPPASAYKQLYQFIQQNRQKIPNLQTILIGGNHDSPSRMEAPTPLFQQFGVSSIGRLPKKDDDSLDFEKILIPLLNRNGQTKALLAAVPYLRQSDLPPPSKFDGDPLVAGVSWVYAQIIEEAKKQLNSDCGLILTGHCYMQGGDISQFSELRILGGGEHALPVDLFPQAVDYVALGHLHKAQKVGERDEVRYSGSPLPLSVTERDYHHAIRVIELDDKGSVARQESIKVPRVVEYLRVPNRGSLSLKDAVAALEKLPLAPQDPGLDLRPFLEVVVELTGPEPGLGSKINQALEGKAVRLAGIQALTTGAENSLADTTTAHSLEEINPEEVFSQLHIQKYQKEPELELIKAFAEIRDGLGEES